MPPRGWENALPQRAHRARCFLQRGIGANARGGDGTLDKRDYVLENMPENAKMFAEIKLEPGCSLGTHTHTGEYEVFFFHEGEVTLNDNGTERKMHPGDFAICYDGESHGIANRTDKPASLFAAIIKTK